jgi:YegS/Rv2252/BmrU family lipid kinase
VSAIVIINPVAGGRASLAPERRAAIAREALDRARIDGRVVLTQRAGHGREIAREAIAAGCRRVVAWGGDGTVNEVAAEVVGTEASLGIVRAGSGNGAARELGIVRRPDEALAGALTGPEHAIDSGEIDGRIFLNVAGIGFDATMALEFNELGTERRGPWRYAKTVLRTVFAYRAARYRLELDGETLESDALLLAIANLPQYGSRAVIAPQAAPFDGLLDLVVIGDRGPLARAGLVPRLFDESIGKAAGVTLRTTRRLVVSSEAPMAYHVDGEPFRGGHRLEAVVQPRSLRFRGAGKTRWPAFFGQARRSTSG